MRKSSIARWVVFSAIALAIVGSSFASCGKRLDYFVGESMSPTINPGDRVYYKRLTFWQDVHVGDIVLAKYQDKDFDIALKYQGEEPTWLVHRIYAAGKGIYLLKGDNHDDPDPVIFKRSDFVGVVCRVKHVQ